MFLRTAFKFLGTSISTFSNILYIDIDFLYRLEKAQKAEKEESLVQANPLREHQPPDQQELVFK